jgi:hypothetical protein
MPAPAQPVMPAPAQPVMAAVVSPPAAAPAAAPEGVVVRTARAAVRVRGAAPAGAAMGPQQQQPAAPQKPRKIPLAEVESIRFERSPVLSARFMGQPNLDFTMPGLSAKPNETSPKAEPKKAETKKDGAAAKKVEVKKDGAAAKKVEVKKDGAAAKKVEVKKDGAAAKTAEVKKDGAAAKTAEVKKGDATPKAEEKKADGSDDVLAPPPGTTVTRIPKVEPKKNGIRDLHLSLFGLRDAKILQATVTCQTDKGPTSWRLDTSNSQDWPLVIRRSGTDLSADVFLEPPPGDCYQKDFQVAINYQDGQAANATAKAGEHTDPQRAVDPKAPAVPPSDAWVYLTDEGKLFGKLGGILPETLRLTTPWQDHLDVPLTRVAGIHLGSLDRKESPESFAKRLKARGSEDLLLAQTKKGEVIAIPGVVEGTENDRLRFRYQGRSRTLPIQQVEGLIMAARQESSPDDPLEPAFSLPGGMVISGRWKDLDASAWKIETAWGQELNLPAAEIQDVRFRGGKMTYLSDLNPSKVEETPFFGHRLSWRRNVNLLGQPLKINGRTYDRGLAVHSRCSLTYDLNGRYATFEALVGFDDAAQGKGRIDCRVFADGKELYANPDLRADGPLVKLSLPVAGAEQLRLLVDFGRGQDAGDRVIWANARLYRSARH